MFGKKKEPEFPPANIKYKIVRGLFGQKKKVPTTKREQRKIKKRLLAVNPKLQFIDDLNEKNSVKVDEHAWIDEIEAFDAFLND